MSDQAFIPEPVLALIGRFALEADLARRDAERLRSILASQEEAAGGVTTPAT